MGIFSKDHLNPKGQHVFISGGSQGLGLSVAILLAKKGAHVTIAARNQAKLDSAVEEIKKHCISPDQKINSVSADLTSSTATSEAFDKASEPFQGKCPEIVLCCAGGAGNILGLFTRINAEQLESGIKTNYFTALWFSHEAATRMVKQGVKGRIVFVSSVVGMVAIPGYSAYAPLKAAIRGLADTLRMELLPTGIKINIYLPATIYSPGYEEEQKSKPGVTQKLEESDEGLTPDACASALIKGLEKGNYMITSDPIGHMFRNSTRGASPINNVIDDAFWGLVASIALPIWRVFAERQVVTYDKRHPGQY